jgi:hypothetical protein
VKPYIVRCQQSTVLTFLSNFTVVRVWQKWRVGADVSCHCAVTTGDCCRPQRCHGDALSLLQSDAHTRSAADQRLRTVRLAAFPMVKRLNSHLQPAHAEKPPEGSSASYPIQSDTEHACNTNAWSRCRRQRRSHQNVFQRTLRTLNCSCLSKRA